MIEKDINEILKVTNELNESVQKVLSLAYEQKEWPVELNSAAEKMNLSSGFIKRLLIENDMPLLKVSPKKYVLFRSHVLQAIGKYNLMDLEVLKSK